MHELSIMSSVVDTVRERVPDATVTCVRMEIGKLSGVLVDSVLFCFDVVVAGTNLEGASLDISSPPGRARCRACGSSFDLDDLIFLCSCGSADVQVLSGRELRITSVEVA
ncbi:hydrogenase maturation nickel metallochaperone HypA [Lentzea tibetensis]|uniref:Hydrogenase maturation factor HypA n=1 Tax=Lentzea tibetensis TaxID=2591470 RepID=A0A563F2T8_9PSEU|nr:hydrogenase maturation nickel metallochaperone HypA [Lentzea tibetensis]TWP54233.1 hydrogenase maturation nickel metallochaperone HypA [Lentzea tibetensis]